MRIWSERYRRWEVGIIGTSVAGVGVGALSGSCVLQHVGALITFAGIVLAFAAVPERQQMAGAVAAAGTTRRLQAARNEPEGEAATRGEAFDAAANRPILARVVAAEVAGVGERHEAGLALAELFVLGLGTLVWGFGDLWPYPPIHAF